MLHPQRGGLVDATAPPRTAVGDELAARAAPTEKKQRSRSPAPSASGVASSTAGRPMLVPAERAEREARARRRSPLGEELERDAADRAGRADDADPAQAWALPRSKASWSAAPPSRRRPRDVARDLDRRGRDDCGLDPVLAQRRERLRGDARVALHSRADDAHLAEVVARATTRRRARRARARCRRDRRSARRRRSPAADLDDVSTFTTRRRGRRTAGRRRRPRRGTRALPACA